MNKPSSHPWIVLTITAGIVLTAALVVLIGACSGKSDSLTAFMSLDCTRCHSGTAEYPVAGAKASYAMSLHATGGNSYYSNGQGCQQCHTHEGFLQFLAQGSIDPKSFVSTPSQPACFTCHDPHKTGDFSLRTTVPVKLDNQKEFSGGKGNLCGQCHRVRGDAAKTVVEMEAAKVSPNFGPHHGPQADMIAGTNAFQFEGKTYSNSPHSSVVKDSCTVCHMGLPEGRYGLSPEIGSHGFKVKGFVHGQEKLNTAGCVACHPDIKQAQGEAVFDKTAVDYDNDGKLEPVQLEVEGLLQTLVNKSGAGLLQRLSPPMYKPDGTWNAVKEGKRSINEVAALYNYKYVLEDQSRGIHNLKYAVQILYDTIAALKPGFDASKRPN